MYSAREPVEFFRVSDAEDVVDTFFNTILQRFQQAQVMNYYISIFKK